MQPLADASVENMVPMNRRTIRRIEFVSRAASNNGVMA